MSRLTRNAPAAWGSLLALPLVYLAAVLIICSPYRFFPSDDLFFQWPLLKMDGQLAWEQAIASHQPVFELTLLAVKKVFSFLGHEVTPSLFLVTSSLSGATIMLSLMLSIQAYSKQQYFPVLIGVVFALSAWTATYFFLFSYAVTSSAYCMASITLLLISSRGRGKLATRLFLSALAGLLMGVYFWSSASGPVLAGLALLLPFVLWEGKGRERLFAQGVFAVAEFVAVAVFGVKSLPALLTHIGENINVNWYYGLAKANVDTYIEAQKWKPLLSFFQVALQVHDPVSVALFVGTVISAGSVVYVAGKALLKESPAVRHGMIVTGYFLVAGMVIDLLPTTKLGRALFQLYPLMLLATFLLLTGIIDRATLTPLQRRRYLGVVLSVCGVGLLVDGCKLWDLYQSRFAFPRYLHEHLRQGPIYTVQEDSHAKWMPPMYGHDVEIRTIPLAEVQHLVTSTAETLRILIGPTERNSSLMSIYLKAQNKDLLQAELMATVPALHEIEPAILPFSALHPAFLMENEVTQALYLQGLVPDWKTSASSLKLYTVNAGPHHPH